MPKNRRHGSIAGRQDDPEQNLRQEEEMSNRLEDRLRQMGPITIQLDSRSRRIRENVSVEFPDLNHARVRTAGGLYYVDTFNNTCTCPDHVHRQGRCRHMEAADMAREQATSGILQGSQQDTETSNRQVISEMQNAEMQAEISIISREYTDDDFFYTEDIETFHSDAERLRYEPVPYYYENVLNGSNITFGIELEFVDGDSDAIAAELYDMGICGNRSMSRYHGERRPGLWTLERDGSVTIGSRGGELISPVLTDTPETWRTIEKVCEVARRHGARVNTDTGGHVHVGAAALDGKRQRWRRFFKMGVGFEHVYRRLSGGEQGVFRGGHYAASSESPLRQAISMHLPAESDSRSFFRNLASNIAERGGGKYQMINTAPLPSKGTVEFRGFNGTLTPGIIQANVKYAAGVVNSAERSRLRNHESLQSTPSDRKRAEIINDYTNNNQKSETAIMRTLDTVFSRKEDKEHILSVITKNSWYNS